MIFHAEEFSGSMRDRSQMLERQIETNVSIKIPIRRVTGIAFVRTPNPAARFWVAGESCWSCWRITGSKNGAARIRRSEQQPVCVEHEPAKIRFLQCQFEPGSVTA